MMEVIEAMMEGRGMSEFKVTATHTAEECTTCAEILRRLDEWPGEACAKSGTGCVGFKEAA